MPLPLKVLQKAYSVSQKRMHRGGQVLEDAGQVLTSSHMQRGDFILVYIICLFGEYLWINFFT